MRRRRWVTTEALSRRAVGWRPAPSIAIDAFFNVVGRIRKCIAVLGKQSQDFPGIGR